MSDLFRPEAVEHRNNRDLGEVSVSVPFAANLMWLVLVGVMLIVVLTSAFGRTSRIERVRGWVRPDSFVVRHFAQQDQYITRIFVSQGETVEKGQILFEASELKGSDRDPEIRGRLSQGLADEELEFRRQLASLDNLARADAERARGQLVANNAKLQTAKKVLDLQKQQIALANESVASASQLFERGYLSKFEWQRRREKLMETQKELLETQEAAAGLNSDRAGLTAERARNEETIARQRSDLQRALIELSRRRTLFRASESYRVVAPSTGKVAQLLVRTGEPVQRGALQYILVAKESHLIAEIFVPSRSAASLRVGQAVQLNFDAFPSSLYGSRNGRVVRASAATLAPDEVPQGLSLAGPVYKADVALSPLPSGLGNSIRLQPGMTLNADLVVDRYPIWRALLPMFKPSESRP